MDNSLSTLTTLARNWWAFILRGVIAIGFGLIVWFWPDLALNTLIWIFAFFAFFTGILAIVAAIWAISQRERWLGLAAEGVIGIGVGIVAVVWPDLTAKTFLYILAAWAIVTGLLSIWSAMRLRREMEGEWVLALSGVALILFGVIAFARPKSGALAVLWLIGLSAIVYGILWVILGLELRRLNATIGLLNRSAARSVDRGSAPIPASASRQSAATTSQGIATSPTSTATASSTVPPATASPPVPPAAAAAASPTSAAAAAFVAAAPATSEVKTESAEDIAADEAVPETNAERHVAPSDAAKGDARPDSRALAPDAEAEVVVGPSTKTGETKADDVDDKGMQSTAESTAVAGETEPDASREMAGDQDGATSQEASAAEMAPPVDARASDASAATDDATEVVDAPPVGDAMSEAETPLAADAKSDASAPVAAEKMMGAVAPSEEEPSSDADPSSAAITGASSSDSGATSHASFVEERPETQDASAADEEAFIVGASSGTSDSSAGALDGVGDSTASESSAGAAAKAAEMPRTTRRERALADLVAGLPPEGSGWVLGNGTLTNPEGYPLKGNASSRIYHAPGGQSYDVTIAEICFATAGDARSAGFRPRQGDPGGEDVADDTAESAVLPPTDESGAVDIAPASEAGAVVAVESVEAVDATPGDIPSEFVSHLVGTPSVEFDAQAGSADSTSDDEAGSAPVETTGEVAPLGGSAAHAPAEEAAQTAEPQQALSRSEQALQDLIATLPPEGSGWVRGTNIYTTPPGYPVKGNASSRIYHLPGGQNYQATIPEICFATVDDAQANGFRPRHGDPAEADWSLVEETPEGVAMGIGHSNVTGATGTSREELQLQEIIAGLPPEGDGWVKGTGVYTTPYGYPVKGNASSRIYHVPGGQNYQATIPEICFVSIDAARDGGFRPRHGDPAEPDWSLVEVTPGTEPIGIAAEPSADAVHPDVAAILAALPSNDPGWRLGDGTVDCPESHPIKGNASSRIFHVEEGRSYKATIPEFCFATEEDALAAGFRKARA